LISEVSYKQVFIANVFDNRISEHFQNLILIKLSFINTIKNIAVRIIIIMEQQMIAWKDQYVELGQDYRTWASFKNDQFSPREGGHPEVHNTRPYRSLVLRYHRIENQAVPFQDPDVFFDGHL
jgi:hypothetical protein